VVAGGAPTTDIAEATRAGGPFQLAACWAHLSRKVHDLRVSGVSQVATETIERMAHLCAIEERIRGEHPVPSGAGRANLAWTALSSTATESRHALTEGDWERWADEHANSARPGGFRANGGVGNRELPVKGFKKTESVVVSNCYVVRYDVKGRGYGRNRTSLATLE
jgi:hypothetical protein